MQKKPRAKPLDLSAFTFEEVVQRAIDAGPYRPEGDATEDHSANPPAAPAKHSRRGTNRAAPPSAKPKRGTARRR